MRSFQSPGDPSDRHRGTGNYDCKTLSKRQILQFTCEFRDTTYLERRKIQEACMRSEIIFRAKEMIDNKYQLCQTASKATRRLHISSRNTQETINSAFTRIAEDSDKPGVAILIPAIA
jgi:hypothetical protein